MKDNTTTPNILRADFDLPVANDTQKKVDFLISADNRSNTDLPVDGEAHPFEDTTIERIFCENDGRGLINFCRELAVILLRRYSMEDDARNLRDRLAASLVRTLNCSPTQAASLIDLSLEMIHSKVYGRYRRTDLELSYLIALATGAISDVSAN